MKGIVLGAGNTSSLQKTAKSLLPWNLHSVNRILEGLILSFPSFVPSPFLSPPLPLFSSPNILVPQFSLLIKKCGHKLIFHEI